MIDIALQLQLRDADDPQRQFTLDVAFQSAAPVLALYGPSGAGKSLTLQAVAGLLRPQAGHVRVGGRTLFDAAQGIHLPPQARRLGYVFQQYALFPHLTVAQNIGFGLRRWGQRLGPSATQRVDELIEAFGLGGTAHSRPAALSGGQQQRVALARALAAQPELLLLDEPLAALNPDLRQQLRAELAQVLRRWQVPTLLITHDAEDVLALADAAVMVEAGRVVREIDLVAGTQRSTPRLAPPPLPERPARPHEAQLRAWLAGQSEAQKQNP